MPFGVMGGHFQPMGQTLFLTNMLEYGLDIQEAIDLPRLFPLKRQAASRARHPGRRGGSAGEAGSRPGAGRTPAWRRPGDLDRPRARLPGRRVGAAQGRDGAGVLMAVYISSWRSKPPASRCHSARLNPGQGPSGACGSPSFMTPNDVSKSEDSTPDRRPAVGLLEWVRARGRR